MFNVVEKHQKLVKGILITITATFVVWGVSGYLGMSGDDGYVAKVGNKKIYSQDIDNAMDPSQGQQQDKTQTLFGLINRQLLINSLNDHHMSVTTEELQKAISALSMFQTNGQFDASKYEAFLKQQYTTSAKFEENIRQQLLIEQMLNFFKTSYFSSVTFQNKFAELLSRERNVSSYTIDPKQFYAKINVGESDIAGYYQQNIGQYTLPEQVKLQYIKLSADDLADTIKITDADLDKYLKAHPELANNSEVDVSHILITIPSNATDEQKAAAKAKAEQILAQVKANPAKFAELAKQYSQDPGSAANGGDLGYFGKGVMAKPFEEAAFAMKTGQVSGVVETQFGFHILKLNAIKGNDVTSVKLAATKQLQKQQAQQKVQAISDELNDLTYNQPDSLDPAAKKTGLAVQTTDWLNKGATTGILANPKLAVAVFTPDVLQKHHNSEVIDMGDGSFIVARVVDYKAASQKPIAEVKDSIVNAIKASQASQMAMSLGQQDIQQLQSGKVKLAFTNPQNVSMLEQSQKVDGQAVQQIFTANKPFPAYVGAPTKDGLFVIYQVNSETPAKTLSEQDKNFVEQLSSQYSMINLNAYIGSLRNQYSVTYKLDRIKGNNSDNQQGQ
ncbi:MAG: peptidylprolyl isomerase [Burkholderiales bacterium]|nr:peptidylprolyl isomerase [Burkholderiales bacterium]